MSFDFWWLLGFVKPEQDPLLRPGFEDALADPDLNDKADAIFRKWRADPECVISSLRTHENYTEFCYAFLLHDFGADLVAGAAGQGFEIDEESTFKFITLGGHSPCSVLWYLLGPERADRLPGVRGNMLLAADEVAAALEAVNEVFSDRPGDDEVIRRAAHFMDLGSTVEGPDRKAVLETFDALPETMAEARDRNCGMFALGMTTL